MRAAYGRETAAAFGGWSAAVRDGARIAGAPGPGEVEAGAARERAETEAELTLREAARDARTGRAAADIAQGRAEIEPELAKPFGAHVAGEVPLVGAWLAGKLYGTAGNAAPDGPDGSGAPPPGMEEDGGTNADSEANEVSESPVRTRQRHRHGR